MFCPSGRFTGIILHPALSLESFPCSIPSQAFTYISGQCDEMRACASSSFFSSVMISCSIPTSSISRYPAQRYGYGFLRWKITLNRHFIGFNSSAFVSFAIGTARIKTERSFTQVVSHFSPL